MDHQKPPLSLVNSNGHAPARKKRHGDVKKTLTAQDWDEIEAMAGAGVSLSKIAAAMDLSERTIKHWRKARASLDRALEKGFAKTEAEIGKVLVSKAKAGDLGAIVWWEKTRAGRRDTTDVTSRGRALGAIVYQIQSAAGELIEEVEAEEIERGPSEFSGVRQLSAGGE